MMSLHDVWKLCFSFFRGKQVSVEPAEENISTDAGLLILRQFDEQQGLTVGFTEQLEDPRRKPEHPLLEMVRSRVFGILAGYEDQNDHDALRSDAIFKVIADRSPDDDDLASQPTLSRFENSVTAKDLLRLEEEFIERFVNSFAEPPREITLDIDVFDDPTHGDQQLTFFHGFYDQYQYLVRAITCAENDMVVLPVLLLGTADPPLGVVSDLERVVTRLREKFPDVLIRAMESSQMISASSRCASSMPTPVLPLAVAPVKHQPSRKEGSEMDSVEDGSAEFIGAEMLPGGGCVIASRRRSF